MHSRKIAKRDRADLVNDNGFLTQICNLEISSFSITKISILRFDFAFHFAGEFTAQSRPIPWNSTEMTSFHFGNPMLLKHISDFQNIKFLHQESHDSEVRDFVPETLGIHSEMESISMESYGNGVQFAMNPQCSRTKSPTSDS